MNLNPNFTIFKLDFLQALQIIKDYDKSLKPGEASSGILTSDYALTLVHRAGDLSPGLQQKILSAKVLYSLLARRTSSLQPEVLATILKASLDVAESTGHDRILA
jgi:hypothetical protein